MHYGVPGMRWGHRKQYRDAVKTAKNKKYKEWDSAENRHEDRVTQINRKYGQHGNNFEGKNSKMNRATKKAYKSEINKAWDSYEKSVDKATLKYKTAKKQAKEDYKQTDEYKTRSKALKVGAAAAGTALAAYGAYKLNKFVRERDTEITIGRKLIEANDDINLNMKNIDNLKRGRNNDTIKMLNDSFNIYADRTLREAESEGRSIAELHSFGEAAKNVYDDYRKRRR